MKLGLYLFREEMYLAWLIFGLSANENKVSPKVCGRQGNIMLFTRISFPWDPRVVLVPTSDVEGQCTSENKGEKEW